jgi:hypothetical protein
MIWVSTERSKIEGFRVARWFEISCRNKKVISVNSYQSSSRVPDEDFSPKAKIVAHSFTIVQTRTSIFLEFFCLRPIARTIQNR